MFILGTTLLDRYENEKEFLREGNVKGPLGMDSRTALRDCWPREQFTIN